MPLCTSSLSIPLIRQPTASPGSASGKVLWNISRLVTTTRHFDFFRDRLMFPVLGAGGAVLGFSGRLLDPEAKDRKYVNSPENPVYRKSEILYGLPQARAAMRRAQRAILAKLIK